MKKVLYVIVMLVTLSVSVVGITYLLEDKESSRRYASFYEEEDEYDVFFVGSSHVRYAFLPMELWQKYGITSYNIAGDGNTIPVSYWILVNALDYHKPKVVVMDIYNNWPGRVFASSWGQVHYSVDAIPLSINKYRMIEELFSDESLTDGKGNTVYNKRGELIFSLGAYHSRWDELTEHDFVTKRDRIKQSRTWKGASLLRGVTKRIEHQYDNDYRIDENDSTSLNYLDRIISLCEDNDIELLLINTGIDCSDESKAFADSVYDIIEKKNIPYIDFTQTDILDYDTDLRDTGTNTHVNFSGAQKLTDYLGNYLSEKYSLQDHRKDSDYKKWYDDSTMYSESKIRMMSECDNIDIYLMMMYAQDYSVIFMINDTNDFMTDKTIDLFENLGINGSDVQDNNMIVLNIPESDSVTYDMRDCINSVHSTPLGDICLVDKGQNDIEILIDNEKITDYSSDDILGIQIIVMNDGNVVDLKEFGLTEE